MIDLLGMDSNSKFREVSKKSPKKILEVAAAVKFTKKAIEDAREGELCSISPGGVEFLPNNLMETSALIDLYRQTELVADRDRCIKGLSGKMESSCRLLHLVDDNEFNEGISRWHNALTYCSRNGHFYGRFGYIDGAVTMMNLRKDDPAIPVVFIRRRLAEEYPDEFITLLKHLDAHAFSLNISTPELAHSQRKGGWINSKEWFMRLAVDEWIANIEAEEPLATRYPNYIYLHHLRSRDEERFKRFRDGVRSAVWNARERVNKNEDLAALLRVVPVQVMERTLPKVLEIYAQEGFPLYKCPA